MPTDLHAKPGPLASVRVGQAREGQPAKIVIAGGFGVGKTTLIGAISEIDPVTTETRVSAAGTATDDLTLVPAKQSTTVAMDFGRITLDTGIVLYLFGTPGQRRFWFMWDTICSGAVGAVVLIDTRRIADAFGPIDYFERNQIPFMVAVNPFDGKLAHPLKEVRESLALHRSVPIKVCDARTRDTVRDVLIALMQHAIATRTAHRSSTHL